MYQVYHVVSGEKGPMSFILRGNVETRREAVNMAASVRREQESSTKRKSAGIYDGDRLVQCVF